MTNASLQRLLLAAIALAAFNALADPTVAPRLALGGGAASSSSGTRGVFELAPRGDIVWSFSPWSLGAAAEVRTANFGSLEGYLGPTALVIDSSGEFAFGVSLLAGYAGRWSASGAGFSATVFAGFRHASFDYVPSTALYVSLHQGFAPGSPSEWTAGLELGGGIFSFLLRLSHL